MTARDPADTFFTVERSTGLSRIAAVVAVPIVVALFALPWWGDRAALRLAGEMWCFLTLATLWNLLAGYAGIVSVGQQAFVGLGGYALFGSAVLFGVPPLAAVLVACVAGALIAVPTGLLLFRLQGAHFAIGSWVAAEVFRLSFAQVSPLGGGSGTSLPAALVTGIARSRELREWMIYWAAFGLGVATLTFVVVLLRSRAGLALTALRDSEIASESVGIDSARLKRLVYVAVAALTAATGALIFLQKLRISPDAAFSVNDWTASVIFIVVIGGIGTIEGPVVGTLVFFLLRESLAQLGAVYLMALGAVAIAVMLGAPKGLWGTLAPRRGISLIPTSRRVSIGAHRRSVA